MKKAHINKLWLVSVFILLRVFDCTAQTPQSLTLDTIRGYPIIVDSWDDHFSYSNTVYSDKDKALSDRKEIFVYSAIKNSAFFKIKGDKKYIYVKRTKKTLVSNDTCREYFSGNGYRVVLTTWLTGKVKDSPYMNYYSGTLVIKKDETSFKADVKGYKIDKSPSK